MKINGIDPFITNSDISNNRASKYGSNTLTNP